MQSLWRAVDASRIVSADASTNEDGGIIVTIVEKDGDAPVAEVAPTLPVVEAAPLVSPSLNGLSSLAMPLKIG